MKICVTKWKFISNDQDSVERIYYADWNHGGTIENAAANSGGGAGITSGQLMVDKGVEAVITGNVGPNAANVLKAANIKIYRGISASVKENIEKFNKGILEKIDTTVPSHFGMGKQRGNE